MGRSWLIPRILIVLGQARSGEGDRELHWTRTGVYFTDAVTEAFLGSQMRF